MPPLHPTIRTIAAAAGVCSATVSLALRNHPSISTATKLRIQRIALKQDYRPDPVTTRLMAHIRTQPSARSRATICALTNFPANAKMSYVEMIDRAARERAESMGYIYKRLSLCDFVGNNKRLSRLLYAQGVDGILLLPMLGPQAFDDLLIWEKYSVVSTSYSVLSPAFHRVVPDQFSNLAMTCRILVARGYRRIGFITSKDNDIRTYHHFTAAILWHNKFGGVESIVPLVHKLGQEDRSWPHWLSRTKPDAVIVWDSTAFLTLSANLKLRIPQDIALVSFFPGEDKLAGIDQRPAAIGATGVDLLTGMIQRGEKGVPGIEKVTMIEGSWMEGWSVPALSSRSCDINSRAKPANTEL